MCLWQPSRMPVMLKGHRYSRLCEPRFPGPSSGETFFHGCASGMARWHNHIALKHVCADPGWRES